MTTDAAEMIWAVVVTYLGAGFLVALLFAVWAAPATDYAAKGSNIWFRLAIMPGAALLWPYMVVRLLSFRRVNQPIPGRETH